MWLVDLIQTAVKFIISTINKISLLKQPYLDFTCNLHEIRDVIKLVASFFVFAKKTL